MKWYTHVVFSFLISILFKFDFLMILVCVFASLLVDIDTPKSKIGEKVKVFSWILNKVFGHRKLFHSMFFAAILSIFIWIFSFKIAFAFFIGYLSHLLIDCLTKEGVMLFYPLKLKFKGFIRTGGILEHILLIILVFLASWKLLNIIQFNYLI